MKIKFKLVNEIGTGNLGERYSNLVISGLKVKLDVTPEFSIAPKRVSVLVGKCWYLHNHRCLFCL